MTPTPKGHAMSEMPEPTGDPSAMGAVEIPPLKTYQYVVSFPVTVKARCFSDAVEAAQRTWGDNSTIHNMECK